MRPMRHPVALLVPVAVAVVLAAAAAADAPPQPVDPARPTAPAPPAAPGAGEEAAPPADLAALAVSLPPLPRHAGGVALLAAGEGAGAPTAWSPIRPGVAVAARAEALAVGFTVVTGAPAGAALLVPPGTFSGIESLRLRARANRNAQLVVSLMEAGGAAFALPAAPLRVGTAREHVLDLVDARFLEGQSTVPDPGRGCDPEQVVMLTLLDVTGFMGTDTPYVEWVIESLEGVAR